MSKKLFLDTEVTKLSRNKNIFNVSNKAITYILNFKKVIDGYKIGKLPHIIFEEAGLDLDILGMARIEIASKRWK
jgi:transposase